MADYTTANAADPTPRARAGESGRRSPKLSTPHAAGVIVLGALAMLIALRAGFAGALGD